MRGNDRALALMMGEVEPAIPKLSRLLDAGSHDMHLSAARLLTILCRHDTAKRQAVRLQPWLSRCKPSEWRG